MMVVLKVLGRRKEKGGGGKGSGNDVTEWWLDEGNCGDTQMVEVAMVMMTMMVWRWQWKYNLGRLVVATH